MYNVLVRENVDVGTSSLDPVFLVHYNFIAMPIFFRRKFFYERSTMSFHWVYLFQPCIDSLNEKYTIGTGSMMRKSLSTLFEFCGYATCLCIFSFHFEFYKSKMRTVILSACYQCQERIKITWNDFPDLFFLQIRSSDAQ